MLDTLLITGCCADHGVSCVPGGLYSCALYLLYQDEEVSGSGMWGGSVGAWGESGGGEAERVGREEEVRLGS